jgi:peroxiredoxin
MKPDLLIGTSIPRFTYDTPFVPGNDFYALCDNDQPLVLIFLPEFDHPITQEYLARYRASVAQLGPARLACVVRSLPRPVAEGMRKRGEAPLFPLLCDAAGVLYGYFSIEQTSNPLCWSWAARRIFKQAKARGDETSYSTSQMLPLTLIVGREGKVLDAHYGRTLTDLPESCADVAALTKDYAPAMPLQPAKAPAQKPRAENLAGDETIPLPAMRGDPD